jgi:hypothetical protein
LASVHRVPPRGVNSFFFTPGPSVHHLYPYRLKIFLRAPYTDYSIAIHLLFCFLLLHWSEKQGQIDKTIFRMFFLLLQLFVAQFSFRLVLNWN